VIQLFMIRGCGVFQCQLNGDSESNILKEFMI